MSEPEETSLPENENVVELTIVLEASAVVTRGTATDDRVYPGEEEK